MGRVRDFDAPATGRETCWDKRQSEIRLGRWSLLVNLLVRVCEYVDAFVCKDGLVTSGF